MTESLQNSNLGDTIDAFVTGYDLGDEGRGWTNQVGSLTFSVFLEDSEGNVKPHEIARVSNISQELREKLTDSSDPENPVLKASWYGKCATIDGQSVSARSYRLTHAVLVDWRPDRSADSCIVKEDFLKSMVL